MGPLVSALIGVFLSAVVPAKPGQNRPVPMTHLTVIHVPGVVPVEEIVEDSDDLKVPNLTCTSHPCVFPYRFASGIHDPSVEAFRAFVEGVNEAHADAMMLEIDTKGGAVDAGHEMARTIELSEVPVICVADGEVESMGFYVLQSCDARFATKRTVFLIHPVALALDEMSPVVRYTPEKLTEMAERAAAYSTAYLEWCASKLKIGMPELKSHFVGGKDWYFDWHTAEKIGAVDKVLDYTPNKLLSKMRSGQKP
jgi:ATP-dependent protease ClpP protease subunit